MSGEFWAAIFGAVVGGVISLGIQLVALSAATKERKEDAAERRKALAYALLFKMIEIHSHIGKLNLHLKESIAHARKQGFKGALWQMVVPLANGPDRVQFSTDEMAMLLSLKDNDLFNDIAGLDAVHNGTIEGFRVYSARRFELTSMLPGAVMEGRVGTTFLTDEQVQHLAPRAVELDHLVEQLLSDCERDEAESWAALRRLEEVLNAKVKLGIRVLPKAATTQN
jgi:hypothetical protein